MKKIIMCKFYSKKLKSELSFYWICAKCALKLHKRLKLVHNIGKARDERSFSKNSKVVVKFITPAINITALLLRPK